MARYIPCSIRQKMREKQHEMELQKMLDDIPKLTMNDVRRFRLPYHVALIEELNEKNLTSSAQYLRQLIDYQTSYKESFFDTGIRMTMALLIHSKKELDLLYESFIKAEEAHNKGLYNEEVDIFLSLSYHYGFESSGWSWLADQLFAQTERLAEQDVVKNYDKGYRIAVIQCMVGQYIYLKRHFKEIAIDLLYNVRDLSRNKYWHLPYDREDMIKTLLIKKPYKAFELCGRANELCEEICINRGYILMLQGECMMQTHDYNQAIGYFLEAKGKLAREQPSANCEARIHLAQAYLESGMAELCAKELEALLVIAEKNNLQKYVGFAYLYSGQYHLTSGNSETATFHLVKALLIFHDMGDLFHKELVQNLAAVSKGHELMDVYFHFIMRANVTREDLRKLLDWKFNRTSFWNDESTSVSELDLLSTVEEPIKECKSMLLTRIQTRVMLKMDDNLMDLADD